MACSSSAFPLLVLQLSKALNSVRGVASGKISLQLSPVVVIVAVVQFTSLSIVFSAEGGKIQIQNCCMKQCSYADCTEHMLKVLLSDLVRASYSECHI